MTTTLEWWQIGGLIALILIAVVIFSRGVILIVMVRTRLWSKLHPNAMSPNVETRHPIDLSESHSKITLSDVPSSALPGVVTMAHEEPYEEPEDIGFLGSTGASPGGVSYDTEAGRFVKAKPTKKARRSRKLGWRS